MACKHRISIVEIWRLAGLDDRPQPTTTLMYRSALTLPLIRTREERAIYSMAFQAITLGVGFLCRYRMQAGEEWSPGNLQTCTRPSEYYTQNRDSSEKTTLCHSCI
ncbi:hypothetical protein TNCV_2637251 [Trichonephila clavipes]|nr:hypothetical protein TNCV_2637251 [Trichonephila clavipes]